MSDSEDFSKITNAYNAAIELWKLASQQIYSRFAAMLTGNSIIIAAIGIIITGSDSPPICLIMGLIIGGLVLSAAWILYMTAGWFVEKHYRRKAIDFERDATGKEIAIRFKDWRSCFFPLATGLTVLVFIAIYVILLENILTGG